MEGGARGVCRGTTGKIKAKKVGGHLARTPRYRGLRPKAETHTVHKALGGQAKWNGGVLCGILDVTGSGEEGEKRTGEEGGRSIKILSVHNTKCQGL